MYSVMYSTRGNRNFGSPESRPLGISAEVSKFESLNPKLLIFKFRRQINKY